MEHKNILDIFWPVLKILQFFGSCPIKKSANTSSGFKSMHSGIYFISFTVTTFLLSSGFFLLNYIGT